jgi:hypothetical protein
VAGAFFSRRSLVQMNSISALFTLLLLFPAIACAQAADKLTMLEGSLKIIRGTNVYKADKATEGMLLRQGDLLESSDGGFAQFEFAGGTIVALGPSSRVFFYRLGRPAAATNQPVANLVLSSGWLKGESTATSGMYRYSTPVLSLASANGSVLLHLDADGCDAYVEAGTAFIGETSSDGGWRSSGTAKTGQFLSRKPGKSLTTLARASSSFVAAMPVAFKDTLPSRSAHFDDKKPAEPRLEHAVTFGDLQPWLALPSVWRRSFVERFKPRLADHEFREQLEAHLRQYPEWDAVLHPEKYPSENPPPSAGNPRKPD